MFGARVLNLQFGYSSIRVQYTLLCLQIASTKRSASFSGGHKIKQSQERQFSLKSTLSSTVADDQKQADMENDLKKARDQEKERKKAEKLQKLVDKKAKQAVAQPAAAQEKSKIKALSELPTYVDTTPEGEKKILVELDDERLKAYNPTAVESAHYAWWEKMGFFRPACSTDQKTDSGETFVIIEPPPNVTGLLHMGHALSGTLQDIMIR